MTVTNRDGGVVSWLPWALTMSLLSTTALRIVPPHALGGPGNPQRLITAGVLFVGRIPNHMGLDAYVAIRQSMVRAAYQARVHKPDVPADAIGYADLDVAERPDAYPAEYRAMIEQYGRAILLAG